MSSLSPPFPEWLVDPSVTPPGTPQPGGEDSFRPATPKQDVPASPSTPPLAEHILGPVGTPKTPSPPPPSTSKVVPPLPPLPPFVLPGPVRPVELAPRSVHDIRIPRRAPTTTAEVVTTVKGSIPIIDLTAQKHIQRTVHRRETSALRRQRRRGFKPWTCGPCKKVCTDSISKANHLKTRAHLLKAKYEGQFCIPCDFHASSPEDFTRHINGKRHKKRIHRHSN